MVHLNIIIQHRHQSSTIFLNGASTNDQQDNLCNINIQIFFHFVSLWRKHKTNSKSVEVDCQGKASQLFNVERMKYVHVCSLQFLLPYFYNIFFPESYGFLKGVLDELGDLERSSLIQDWSTNGQVYLDFININQVTFKQSLFPFSEPRLCLICVNDTRHWTTGIKILFNELQFESNSPVCNIDPKKYVCSPFPFYVQLDIIMILYKLAQVSCYIHIKWKEEMKSYDIRRKKILGLV